jgi:hypothetical protein
MFKFALTLLPALVVMSPAPAVGQGAQKTLVSAIEVPLTVVSAGTVTYPGGNIHVRGRLTIAEWFATDPRLTFKANVTTNGNFDANGNGPMSGTFESMDSSSSSGKWIGHWHGEVTDNLNFRLMHTGVGRGTGAYEGLQVIYECAYTGPAPAACQAQILATPKK